MELTGLGVFAFLDYLSIGEAGAFAKRAEELGWRLGCQARVLRDVIVRVPSDLSIPPEETQ